jgi:tRNA nucleotidyltransferase (CCA-adding enzyme)
MSEEGQAALERLVRWFPEIPRIPRGCVISGGAVRDALIDVEPADLDLASGDAPGHAAEFARRTRGRQVTLGTRFLTERVVAGGRIYDFSPIQGEDPEADLGRRDFTINAIGLDLEGRLLDPWRGAEDLNAGRIRMVTEKNFLDDPLRILRAARMAGSFGFSIEDATLAACRRHVDRVLEAAPERITFETRLVLSGRFPDLAAASFRAIGLDRVMLGFALEDTEVAAWARLGSEADPLATVALLFDHHPQLLDRFVSRTTFSSTEERAIRATRRVIDAVGRGNEREVLEVAATEGADATERARRVLAALQKTDAAETLTRVLKRPSVFDVEALLDGEEISRLTSLPPGPRIGELKHALWRAQLHGDVRTREEAVAWIRRLEAGGEGER